MNLFELLKKNAIKFPTKEALIIDEFNLTYKDLFDKVVKTILVLKKNNINKKSTIVIIEDNSLSHILSIFSLAYLGSKVIPLSSQYSKDWMLNKFKKIKIEALISNAQYAKFFKKKINLKTIITTDKSIKFNYFYDYKKIKKKKLKSNFVNANKDFLILLSSGSTGNPKPIVFTQKIKILRSKLMHNLYKINERDRVIVTCPIDHSLGMRLLFLPLVIGGTCIVMKKFTSSNYFKMVKNHKVTFSILVSSQIYGLLKDKTEFDKFYLKRGLVSASSTLSNDAKQKIIDKKIKLYEMYGASEIGTVTSINLNKERKKIKSVGKSYNKNIKIKILSDKNKFLKNNQKGEIVCKTPVRFKNYLGLKKITKNSFFKSFFRTGDIGYLDNKKYLYFLGRKKNIIRRSGITIYPEDIENIFINDKNIQEVAVIGIKNISNEDICLFVKKNKKISLDYIKEICIKKLSTFQIPNKIYLINEFPKTNLGKIDKKLLLNFL
jgi:long-chain acyl-CoA synthetase